MEMIFCFMRIRPNCNNSNPNIVNQKSCNHLKGRIPILMFIEPHFVLYSVIPQNIVKKKPNFQNFKH